MTEWSVRQMLIIVKSEIASVEISRLAQDYLIHVSMVNVFAGSRHKLAILRQVTNALMEAVNVEKLHIVLEIVMHVLMGHAVVGPLMKYLVLHPYVVLMEFALMSYAIQNRVFPQLQVITVHVVFANAEVIHRVMEILRHVLMELVLDNRHYNASSNLFIDRVVNKGISCKVTRQDHHPKDVFDIVRDIESVMN